MGVLDQYRLAYPGTVPNSDYSGSPMALTPPPSPDTGASSYLGAGLQGASAGLPAAGALPWVGAGLSAVGLLSGLYGQYKSNENADRNYQLQMQEYLRQVAIEDQARKLAEQKQQFDNSLLGGQYADAQQKSMLSPYAAWAKSAGI